MRKIYAIIMIIACCAGANSYADTFYVTNNQTSGSGSLDLAIASANNNPGKDSILFNIPSGTLTARTIVLSGASPLPTVTDAVIIDGTSQVAGNYFGVSTAKIQITAADYLPTPALTFNADSCEMYGLYINHFQTGVKILGGGFKVGAIGDGNVINDCSDLCMFINDVTSGSIIATFVGIDTNAVNGVSATATGILIQGSKKITVGGKQAGSRNLISGNNVGIKIADSKYVDVQGNYIGVEGSGYFASPNTTGILVTLSSANVNIGGDSLKEQNVISGNLESGIDVEMLNSTILGNLIGTDATGTYPAGNGQYGIYVRDLSHDNMIGGTNTGEGNVIAYNGNEAVYFQNAGVKNISIRGNRMYCNSKTSGNGGIVVNNGNQGIVPPSLVIVTSNFVMGNAPPGTQVDIYGADSCQACEGSSYLITIIPDESGVFSISVPVTGKVTATSNDSLGNTSEFALCQDSSTSTCILAAFVPDDSKVCGATVINFNDQSITIPGSTITSWHWDFGDGTTTTASDPSHSYDTAGEYTVQMIVENSEGCTDTMEQIIEVQVGVTADFTSETSVCLGDSIHFVDTSIPDGTSFITSWNWDLGNGDLSGFASFSYLYDQAGTYDVTLEVINSNGCSSSITKQIQVSEKPEGDFSFVATPCTLDPVQFTDLSTVGSGSVITSWLWDFADGNTSTDQNPTHTFPSTGTYNVKLTVTADGACSDAVTQGVQILASPVADFTFILNGLSVLFQNNSAVNGDYAVTWDFGDGNTSTSSNPTHVYASDGSYEVCLIVEDFTCTLSDTVCETILVTGIEDFINPDQLIISPNPASEEIVISNIPSVIDIDVLVLYNVIGEKITSWNISRTESDQIRISIPEATSGVYLLSLETKQGTILKKLIINKE